MSVTLKDEKLLDEWGAVIEEAAGYSERLSERIQKHLREGELPGVAWKTVEATPGMIKGFMGKKRQYLMVTSESLRDYRMYVGSRDYGRHLNISWFLTVEPGFFKKRLSSALTDGENRLALSLMLDLFDQQDLRAYVTSVHRCCVRRAVEGLAAHLELDISTFNWKSKGFLEVW